MEGGTLEVLLVKAQGLRERVLGSSKQYVVLQCGGQCLTSKTSLGENGSDWWNEKFIFKLSSSQCKNLKHLYFRIMETGNLREDCLIGKASVYIGYFIREGTLRGRMEVKPKACNVTLEDGTCKGKIKIGLKFISKVEREVGERVLQPGVPPRPLPKQRETQSICKAFLNLTMGRIGWPNFYSCKKPNCN